MIVIMYEFSRLWQASTCLKAEDYPMNPNGLSIAAVAVVLLGIQPATAQHHGGGHEQSDPPAASDTPTSPYVGMEVRRIKALSDKEIQDLEAGHGMGLALAAELNGYPGPLHVIELAGALQLSDQQRSRTQELILEMKAQTIPIGHTIMMEETALDRLFAERLVTQASLNGSVERIAAAQGALRAAHLRFHLAMAEILSPAQIARYAELRGYGGGRHGTE
jgi:hypothetical protein